MDQLNKRFPIYSRLLRLYPTAYRHDYAEQMLQTLADMLDDPDSSPALSWAKTALDYPLSLAYQQLSFTGVTMQTTPNYIKYTARVGAFMLAPFFILLILNSALGQRLHHSVFWHTNVLFAWLILLPGVALLVNLVALVRWIRQQRRDTKQSIWKIVLHVQLIWPVLVILVLGLGILALVFGHDSVHCVSGNPYRELHNPRDTIRCIQRGNS